MRILIATGIFKPELGGPATVALELASRLEAGGHAVTVVTYSDLKNYKFDADFSFKLIRIRRSRNKIYNYLRYFVLMLRYMPKHDLTYALDWFSAGLPVLLASKLTHTFYCVRVGGGYIWEKYLSQGKPPVTLKEFYAKKLHKQYRLIFWCIKRVLRNASLVIFNSDEQRELYEEVYALDKEKTATIYNALPDNRLSGIVSSYNTYTLDRDKEIVFAGRFIKMKNVESLVKAFAECKDRSFRLLLIGDGPLKPDLVNLVRELDIENRVDFLPPMSQSDLYKRIVHSYLVVIPSWTDISPHQAYECLALGIPFLLTKENYLSINKEKFLKIDPHSVADIAEKINSLLDPWIYKQFVDELRRISFHHPWSEVVEEHLAHFTPLISRHDRH